MELVCPLDGAAVGEVFRRALAEAPHTRGFMQLSGRFATEVVRHPNSDFSRLIRTEVLERGHRLRLLAARIAVPNTGTRALLYGVPARQVHLRVSDAPLPDLTLLGTELALVRAAGPEGQPQILLARHEATAALYQFHQVLWGHAKALLPPPSDRPLSLDDAQREVLRMLGSGMKDDTAARQMNVSVRTYRRHVAAILSSMDVNTRFEAGLKAAALGLLSVN
ncbi:helix-turn-helix transcriptional regulator [Streptomyces sp. NPDC047085]|uniref:helix-turn-helix transcriptional regulator n=1 Tax=Streptomyces sp. NPDC047085 TaxID=3155140 RepID=UPI0033DF5CFB